MKNPVVQLGVDVLNAISALRLKRHDLRAVSEGVEIIQPGKPTLLLTYAAAEDFSNQMAEADHG